MTLTGYNFERCKLCGEHAAKPTYPLADGAIYVCPKCDFHYLNYLDDEQTTTPDRKLDKHSQGYIDTRCNENAYLMQQRLKLVQSHLDLKGCKTLDIGAGLGQFQILLTGHGGQSYGIEPSATRRKYAKKKLAVTLSTELVDSDYWQDNYSGYFDLITLWDVIEHVNFPHETILSSCKLLKPGGKIFIDTPSRDTLPYKLSMFTSSISSGKMNLFLPSFYATNRFGHKQIFTPLQLEQLLLEFGVNIFYRAKSHHKNSRRGNKIILGGEKPIPPRKVNSCAVN